ncbi:MAG: tryptophan synthase subunit alpha [Bacteroidetes bacterium]|nr:tryptophan synthase subunit alpha [Bacteroidota bacterium]
MNRIDKLFSDKREEILSIYMTAGFPELDDTTGILQALQAHGADMVEIGIPFSDPLADGPVIQNSSQVALANGMSLEILFSQLKQVRQMIHIPLLLMGYLNPILRFGMQAFLERCSVVGIDGVIIPDLPPDDYEALYRDEFQKQGVHNVLLITPHTDEARIGQIARLSGGFLYMVADSSTTGARSEVQDHQLEYFRRIASMELDIPRLVGFGIFNNHTFRSACSHAKGAIIGSAFIRMLEEEGFSEEKIGGFIRMIRAGED